jgi:CRP-like cAMP-binding protein
MESSNDTLQKLLVHLAGVLPADASPLLDLTSTVSIDANETYIREGETSRKLAFIEKGIIRAYAINALHLGSTNVLTYSTNVLRNKILEFLDNYCAN